MLIFVSISLVLMNKITFILGMPLYRFYSDFKSLNLILTQGQVNYETSGVSKFLL